ncbi:YgiT-type zinc finger protein [Candidatus Woesearchaeota archaeon]|nr:YgiT-type zinc finger protein [Candidatus Woesearchaeota archaeon]
MSEKCYICEKGELLKKKVDVKPYGVSIGKFDAQVCTECNETFFSEQTSDKIDEVAKIKGLWGLEARTKIGQVGNSIDVKISKKIAEFAGLKKGGEVRVYPEGKNRIIIESA